jgi:hypothetical protein
MVALSNEKYLFIDTLPNKKLHFRGASMTTCKTIEDLDLTLMLHLTSRLVTNISQCKIAEKEGFTLQQLSSKMTHPRLFQAFVFIGSGVIKDHGEIEQQLTKFINARKNARGNRKSKRIANKERSIIPKSPVDQKSKIIIEKGMDIAKKGMGRKIATLDEHSKKSALEKIEVPFPLPVGVMTGENKLVKCSGCMKQRKIYFFGNSKMCKVCKRRSASSGSDSSSSSSDSEDSKDEGCKDQDSADQQLTRITEERMAAEKKGTGREIATCDEQFEKSASKKIDAPSPLPVSVMTNGKKGD